MGMTWVCTMTDNTHTLLRFATTVRAVELVTELRRSEDNLWGRAQRKLFIAQSTSPPTQMVFHFTSSVCLPWASFIFPITLQTLPQAFWIEYIIQLTGCTPGSSVCQVKIPALLITVWHSPSSALRHECEKHHYHTLQRDSLAANADWKMSCRKGEISLTSV